MARKLRPINETRRPDGTLTSETAYRLIKRRGGLARAAQMKADGYQHLAKCNALSALVRRSKRLERSSCQHCKPFHESITRQLQALLASKQPATPIDPADQAKIT